MALVFVVSPAVTGIMDVPRLDNPAYKTLIFTTGHE